jgi:hypothetical protein
MAMGDRLPGSGVVGIRVSATLPLSVPVLSLPPYRDFRTAASSLKLFTGFERRTWYNGI